MFPEGLQVALETKEGLYLLFLVTPGIWGWTQALLSTWITAGKKAVKAEDPP